jgi:BirA family biotin operon repressor/biotin-[acetyl-CoA-carboxylase] ligase
VGLAFSLVLRSPSFDPQLVSRLTGLGSLAIRIALQRKYALSSQIKWPNDILIDQRKVAGVLVEAHWIGDSLKAVVIGIGINIASESVSSLILPAKGLNFPATCLETALGHPVNRLEVLHAVLEDFFSWLPRLTSPDFIHEWEIGLAYRHQWVELSDGNDPRSSSHADTPHHIEAGKVIGLTSDGFLKLLTSDGKLVTAQVGEIHLKPISAGHASLPAD